MIDDVFAEVRVVRHGRANGSIIGRNTFIAALLRAMSIAVLAKRRGRREDLGRRAPIN